MTNEATHGDAFATSATGTPDPLTIREVVLLVNYLADLARLGDTVNDSRASAVVQALSALRDDLTPHGQAALADGLSDWSEHYGWSRFDNSPTWLTPGLLAWFDDDCPPAGSAIRRLLTHLTAYRARRSCGPRHVPAWNYDGSGRSRVRPARRARWDDARLMDEDHPAHGDERAYERFARRLDLAELRAAGRLAAETALPVPTNRAERRAATFGHAAGETIDLDQAEESVPPRRPCTEPRTANAPPHAPRAFAA